MAFRDRFCNLGDETTQVLVDPEEIEAIVPSELGSAVVWAGPVMVVTGCSIPECLDRLDAWDVAEQARVDAETERAEAAWQARHDAVEAAKKGKAK